MNKERLDDLVDILAAEYGKAESTMAVRIQQELFKHLEAPETWALMQASEFKAFAEDAKAIARKILKSIDGKTEKAILLSYREVSKDAIEVSEAEIRVKELPKGVESFIKSAKAWNAEQVDVLAREAIRFKAQKVSIISQTATPDLLYEAVKRQMPRGISEGIRVAYKDGSTRSWRSYMEMSIRTSLNAEASEMQAAAGATAGIVFYACDLFADCAPDHAEWQGKLYYNEQAPMTAEIRDFIQRKGLRSMQSVMRSKPWLTTRPNCRHSFHAIPTDEAMGKSVGKILEDNGFKFGEYDKRNYKALQQQRLNERMIRKYKERADAAANINGETSTRILSPERAEAMAKVEEWQRRQRSLIKSSGGVLKRDYARESARLMAEDVGVKYDYKVVDGELEKK